LGIMSQIGSVFMFAPDAITNNVHKESKFIYIRCSGKHYDQVS
jgi:hypothetical protein